MSQVVVDGGRAVVSDGKVLVGDPCVCSCVECPCAPERVTAPTSEGTQVQILSMDVSSGASASASAPGENESDSSFVAVQSEPQTLTLEDSEGSNPCDLFFSKVRTPTVDTGNIQAIVTFVEGSSGTTTGIIHANYSHSRGLLFLTGLAQTGASAAVQSSDGSTLLVASSNANALSRFGFVVNVLEPEATPESFGVITQHANARAGITQTGQSEDSDSVVQSDPFDLSFLDITDHIGDPQSDLIDIEVEAEFEAQSVSVSASSGSQSAGASTNNLSFRVRVRISGVRRCGFIPPDNLPCCDSGGQMCGFQDATVPQAELSAQMLSVARARLLLCSEPPSIYAFTQWDRSSGFTLVQSASGCRRFTGTFPGTQSVQQVAFVAADAESGACPTVWIPQSDPGDNIVTEGWRLDSDPASPGAPELGVMMGRFVNPTERWGVGWVYEWRRSMPGGGQVIYRILAADYRDMSGGVVRRDLWLNCNSGSTAGKRWEGIWPAGAQGSDQNLFVKLIETTNPAETTAAVNVDVGTAGDSKTLTGTVEIGVGDQQITQAGLPCSQVWEQMVVNIDLETHGRAPHIAAGELLQQINGQIIVRLLTPVFGCDQLVEGIIG